MKETLKKSISLFPIKSQLLLYLAVLSLKLKIKLPGGLDFLFKQCIDYVNGYETGVIFKKEKNGLIRATLLVNNRTVVVFLRSNSSDLRVLESVLLQHEYRPAVQRLMETKGQLVNQIVDAGGNIGLTSIYFQCYFPDAHYTIIEPDERNFSLLKKNIEINGFKHILLLKNALWINSESLVISDSFRDGKEWSLTVERKELNSHNERRTELTGITLEQICLNNNEEVIDLLKIDIEGAERFLFINVDFLEAIKKYVNNIVIEIHNEFSIRDTINTEMDRLNFTKGVYSDITLFSKKFN